jgi:hypothetical protein
VFKSNTLVIDTQVSIEKYVPLVSKLTAVAIAEDGDALKTRPPLRLDGDISGRAVLGDERPLPQYRVHPRLPASLRAVPSHSTQLKRRYQRRQRPRTQFALFAFLFVCVFLSLRAIAVSRQTLLNYFLSAAWSIYAPLVVVGMLGAVYRVREERRRRRERTGDIAHRGVSGATTAGPTGAGTPRSEFDGRSSHHLIVTLPTLMAPRNLPALQRVLLSLLVNLPNHFNRFHVDVITEESVDVEPLRRWLAELGELSEPIRIVGVPTEYRTPNRARFKTRANHYAMETRRQSGEHTPDAYIYHLDDDTHIGKDTAASLAEFIELRGDRFLLAQGILSFPHSLTPSRFCRLADSIRPADDLTRFAFFTGLLGTPLGGLHGEHLIVRADIEDEIGWDFPNTVIEDAYFAIQFAVRHPGKSTMLNSYSYGASPASIRDLIRQRRRWIEGLLRLAFNRTLPFRPKIPLLYSIFAWTVAPLQFVGLALLISYCTGIDNTSPVSPWLLPVWSITLAGVFWMYIEGLKVNLSASHRPRPSTLRAVLIVPAIYAITAVETFAVALGVVRFLGLGRQRVSEVITKPI